MMINQILNVFLIWFVLSLVGIFVYNLIKFLYLVWGMHINVYFDEFDDDDSTGV